MKNFIKVIDAYDIEKVINIDFIQSLYKDEDYTIIRFSKDDCIYVKDSYEELSRKLLKLPSETKPSTRKTGRGYESSFFLYYSGKMASFSSSDK